MVIQLDFEKYQGRVDTSRKKTKRSERDNAYLAKAETELVRAKEVRPSSLELPVWMVLKNSALRTVDHTITESYISIELNRHLTHC